MDCGTQLPVGLAFSHQKVVGTRKEELGSDFHFPELITAMD